MSEKKTTTKTSKLKNFLVTGSTDIEKDPEDQKDMPSLDEYEYASEEGDFAEDITSEEEPKDEAEIYIDDEPEDTEEEFTEKEIELMDEISELKALILSLKSDLEKCTTTKEQLKEYSAIINKRETELTNRKFMGMLEQLSSMREDFFKLCKGIGTKIDKFSAKEVLNSFEAYEVDMANMLTDCGVYIGQFKYERLNTLHQRIVDVIPTDEESMNGMIAERVSDGYEYNGRILFKEKVNIYKFTEKEEEKESEE